MCKDCNLDSADVLNEIVTNKAAELEYEAMQATAAIRKTLFKLSQQKEVSNIHLKSLTLLKEYMESFENGGTFDKN